jgi:hypothetical protein
VIKEALSKVPVAYDSEGSMVVGVRIGGSDRDGYQVCLMVQRVDGEWIGRRPGPASPVLFPVGRDGLTRDEAHKLAASLWDIYGLIS